MPLSLRGNDDASTHERSGELGFRSPVEILGRTFLLDPPSVEESDALGEGERFFLIVRDVEDAHGAFPVKPPQEDGELVSESGVQAREGLVEKEEPGLRSKRPRQSKPLPLASGHFAGAPSSEARESNTRERVLHLMPGDAGRREGEVLLCGHMRPESKLLEDHRDAPRRGRNEQAAGLGHDFVLHPDEAAPGSFEARRQSEHGALPASGGPQKDDELSRFDAKREVTKDVAPREVELNRVEPQVRHFVRRAAQPIPMTTGMASAV